MSCGLEIAVDVVRTLAHRDGCLQLPVAVFAGVWIGSREGF